MLARLDPAERALLDLSLRHGFSDAELARLTGSEESRVARRRAQVLADVAHETSLDAPEARSLLEHELRAAPSNLWLGEGDGGASGAYRPQRRALALALAAVALTVAIAALVLAGDSGGDEAEPASSPADEAPAGVESEPAAEAVTPTPGGAFSPVPGSGAKGSVGYRIAAGPGSEPLVIDLAGLGEPPGAFRLWLYGSARDSVALGGHAAGTGSFRVELPASASEYRYLDLSRESSLADGRHSGESLFRTPIPPVLAAASDSGEGQPSGG